MHGHWVKEDSFIQTWNSMTLAEKSLKLEPDDAYTLNRKGAGYRNLKQYDKSLNNLNKSLRIQPTDACMHWK